MTMKNNAKTGGILSIVSGGLGVMSAFGLVIWGIVCLAMGANRGYWGEGWMEMGVAVFLVILAVCRGLLGVLAVIGGAFALKKKVWGLALAGSITSILCFWPCGIPAVIFTAMGKPEFGANTAPQSPAPMEKIVG
jgi:hypothetical protein